MSKQQCKNTSNNIKSNTALSEPSGSTTAGPEHPNADEAENDLKNSFMRWLRPLKGNEKFP